MHTIQGSVATFYVSLYLKIKLGSYRSPNGDAMNLDAMSVHRLCRALTTFTDSMAIICEKSERGGISVCVGIELTSIEPPGQVREGKIGWCSFFY